MTILSTAERSWQTLSTKGEISDFARLIHKKRVFYIHLPSQAFNKWFGNKAFIMMIVLWGWLTIFICITIINWLNQASLNISQCNLHHTAIKMYKKSRELGSTNYPLADIFLFPHYLSAWYCNDIVRRDSVLVTHGS